MDAQIGFGMTMCRNSVEQGRVTSGSYILYIDLLWLYLILSDVEVTRRIAATYEEGGL